MRNNNMKNKINELHSISTTFNNEFIEDKITSIDADKITSIDAKEFCNTHPGISLFNNDIYRFARYNYEDPKYFLLKRFHYDSPIDFLYMGNRSYRIYGVDINDNNIVKIIKGVAGEYTARNIIYISYCGGISIKSINEITKL